MSAAEDSPSVQVDPVAALPQPGGLVGFTIRYLAAPATLGLTALTYAALLERPRLAFVGASVVMSLCLVVSERVAPLRAFRESPHQRITDVWFNVGTATLLLICHPLIVHTPELWTGLSAAPPIAQFLAGWALHDLVLYVWHRALHESGEGALWRLHAPHHQPTRLNFMAGGRSHLAEIGVAVVALAFAGAALNLSEAVMQWLLMMPVASGALHHTNADFRMGWFNYVFPGPEMHRAHHDRDPAEALNYATSFPLWDVVFGSAAPLRSGRRTRYGLADRDDRQTTWRSAHLGQAESGPVGGGW